MCWCGVHVFVQPFCYSMKQVIWINRKWTFKRSTYGLSEWTSASERAEVRERKRKLECVYAFVCVHKTTRIITKIRKRNTEKEWTIRRFSKLFMTTNTSFEVLIRLFRYGVWVFVWAQKWQVIATYRWIIVSNVHAIHIYANPSSWKQNRSWSFQLCACVYIKCAFHRINCGGKYHKFFVYFESAIKLAYTNRVISEYLTFCCVDFLNQQFY